MVNKDKLIIISQNFKGNINCKIGENRLEKKKKNKTGIANYLKHYNADIVAGQELPAHINEKEFIEANKLIGSFDGQAEGQSQFFTGFYVNNNKNYKMGLHSCEEIKEIWENLFKGCPGYSFKSGYWAEKWIEFCDEKIRIINLHISTRYVIQFRVSLLKYLSQTENPYTIILGDFNAAKNDQTAKKYEENHDFLKMIEANKYIELIDEVEVNGESHHTYYLEGVGRKIDHIFVSKAFYDKFYYEIEYIDEVNETHPKYQNSNQTFTDHSGIRVCFYEKNYDMHNKKGIGAL